MGMLTGNYRFAVESSTEERDVCVVECEVIDTEKPSISWRKVRPDDLDTHGNVLSSLVLSQKEEAICVKKTPKKTKNTAKNTPKTPKNTKKQGETALSGARLADYWTPAL